MGTGTATLVLWYRAPFSSINTVFIFKRLTCSSGTPLYLPSPCNGTNYTLLYVYQYSFQTGLTILWSCDMILYQYCERVKRTCPSQSWSLQLKKKKRKEIPLPVLSALGGCVLSSSPIHLKEEKSKLNSGTTRPPHRALAVGVGLINYSRVLLPISHYSVLVQNSLFFFFFNLRIVYNTSHFSQLQ